MTANHKSELVALAFRVLIISMLLGGSALLVFKWLFTEVVRKETLTLIALLSLTTAAALDVVWSRRRKREKDVQ